jgi:hypothetical protein
MPSEEISRAYCLAQRASGHYVGKKKKIVERPMLPAVENEHTLYILVWSAGSGSRSDTLKRKFSAWCSSSWGSSSTSSIMQS